MTKRALEKSALFPYLAWTLIIGFSIFVGSLALELRHTIEDLRILTQTTNTTLPLPGN